MLSVTNLAGQSEPITKYNNYERYEEVNGSLELSLSSFFHGDNPGHELIEEESTIEKDGYEFRVKQLSSNRLSKQVVAISTFFDLNHVLKEDIFAGTKTFNEFAAWLLAGTGWTYENVDVTGSGLIPNFGDGNVIALTKILTATFECEYQILPGKVVRFATQIGADNDAQYRYGNNIKALSKEVDTTKLRTRIKGIGGNGLQVVYTSLSAGIFGIRDAETVSDDRYTVADSLTEYVKRQLTDYPEITIELDAIELQQKEIGERVWLIYEPLGIEFQTRVLSKTSRIPDIKSSVVIGNAVTRSLSDILTSTRVDIDVNKKQTQSKFEQTNEKFTLEVERVDDSIAALEVSYTIVKSLSIDASFINVTYEVEKGDTHQYYAQYSYTTDGSGRMISLTLEDIFSELLLKEVSTLMVDAARFEITYADQTTTAYTYTIDSSGRITGIERET